MSYRNTTGWQLAGTKSFRLASRKLLGKWGSNLQNPSDNICRIYIPDEGKILVQVDQAGAEALIVAYLAPPGPMRDLFFHRIKVHSYVALHLFADFWEDHCKTGTNYIRNNLCKAPIPELMSLPKADEIFKAIKKAKNGEFYFIGKKVCHASNYGMGVGTFRMEVLKESGGKVVISQRDAAAFLDMYHTLFPQIKMWHQDVKNQVERHKILYNLFGYPREFTYAFVDHELLKDAYSWVPQSTVGTLTNIAFTECQNEIEEFEKDEWDMLNNKHDSILGQCPIKDRDGMISMFTRHLEKELTSPRGEKFTMRSEASTGMNWGKYHEKENLEGMKDL